jgi:single-stranded-DNA-specific exonuclease
VAKLLELCKRSGDRPTDISFGIGPRINAVSRIHGDASFCVELLTRRDESRTQELALQTELANARRQELQRHVAAQVDAKLAKLDLSTTYAIVLDDPQWSVGVLGLVAGQVAQAYGRPTILLNRETVATGDRAMARGSARSVGGIDLYELVASQSHLLDRFGGHPYAAGLSLPVENIPLFTEAINRELLQRLGANRESVLTPVVQADLTVAVAELGKALFRELKLLEPCGMGNPVPQLLICDCWFEQTKQANIRDSRGRKLKFIKSEFKLCDATCPEGFPGFWWGHYQDEIPVGRCDAIVELDFNAYRKYYEVRLIAVRSRQPNIATVGETTQPRIADWRSRPEKSTDSALPALRKCPASWDELQGWIRRLETVNGNGGNVPSFAIAYSPPDPVDPDRVWVQLVGMAKYLARVEKSVTRQKLCKKLAIGDRVLELGFEALKALGFKIAPIQRSWQFSFDASLQDEARLDRNVSQFLEAVREEQFARQYFAQIPVETLEAAIENAARS